MSKKMISKKSAAASKKPATAKKSTKPAANNAMPGGAAQLAVIDRMQPLLWIKPDGTVLNANPAFLKLFGYELHELKGQSHGVLVDAADRAGEAYAEFISRLGRGEPDSARYRCVAKDGHEIWVQSACVAVKDAAGKVQHHVQFMTDVSDLTRSADAVRAELEVRTQIMNETSIVSMADKKGDILSFNQKYLEISKYSPEELIGSPHSITRHPDMPKETFKKLWATIGRGGVFRGVIKNRAKDGTPYYVDAVIAPFMGKNGKPEKYLGVRYDITQTELERQNMRGIVDALNKSQAVIEFNLDGTIIQANDNFLGALGYSLDEIKGRHHRIFVEPAYAATPEYRAFWEKLGRGEYDSGQYKRIHKDGREVWIQASYNPISDEMGRPFKVVKYATDITAQVHASQALQLAVEQTQNVVSAAKDGDLTQRIPMEGKNGSIETLCAGVNSLVENMAGIVGQIKEATEAINTAAKEIATGNSDLSARTEQQAASLEETASSMEELTSTVKQNAENAKQANQLAIGASDVAIKGGSVVGGVVTTMSQISDASKKIADIIGVIDGIAFQTNILALNAAVEAARAGEQGRGFAVVAAEVRSLAQRSAGAAKEIKTLIGDSVEKVSSGSKLVEQAGKTMDEIVTSVKRVTDIMSEISAASQEQSSGIEQVNQTITQMDEVTQQNAALVEEATASARSLEEQAASLTQSVGKFRLDDRASSPAVQARAPQAAARPAISKPVAKPAARPAVSAIKRNPQPAVSTAAKSDEQWTEF